MPIDIPSPPPPPDRSHIHTEGENPASARLDELSIEEAVAVMNAEDAKVVAAVARQRPAIARAVRMIADAFANGGRLIYLGAGTSGRLGVLDASECPPTFCSDPDMVVGLIAGGDVALRRSIENVEDDPVAGADALRDLAVTDKDVVMGIAAGGTTPYVHGALREAALRGAKTIFLICTDPAHLQLPPGIPDLFIAIETGAEILTGSTRLKAGTATKLVLNTLTTLAMVQIGKTFGNLMVDIDALKNAKLVDRGARIISRLTGATREESLKLLHDAGGKVKRAIVMRLKSVDVFTADNLLKEAHGKLRTVIQQ
ncbi:MAG TPA: N-acetylmuramic acid 6-phosphate etherase [Phycisphaerae bacterium]|nr:N-acetylmuramic acid 6-phosphate etherase [Phycisphaerae bacterium]